MTRADPCISASLSMFRSFANKMRQREKRCESSILVARKFQSIHVNGKMMRNFCKNNRKSRTNKRLAEIHLRMFIGYSDLVYFFMSCH